MLIAMMVLGLLLVVLMMALIINPPEAWIKKFFRRHGAKGDDPKSQ